jgi:hypothetical protein
MRVAAGYQSGPAFTTIRPRAARPGPRWPGALAPDPLILDVRCRLAGPTKGRVSVQEMVIYGVSFDMVGKQPIVLLKTIAGNKFLPIWIGHAEAAAILMKLQGAETPRPS